MHQIVALDTHLLLLLNGTGQTWSDCFWTGYTSLLSWWPCALVMVVVLWHACDGSWRRRLLVLLALALVITALDQTSSTLLKPLFCRLRPSHDPAVDGLLHYVGGYRGGMYGFPSGHATNSAGIAAWLWLTFRHTASRCCFALFALAMGYSRIYLGVHYPFDILVGFLLGILIATASYFLLSRFVRLHTNRQPTWLLVALGLTVVVLALRAI